MESGMRHLRFAQYKAGPWRNGRGTTYEIAASTATQSATQPATQSATQSATQPATQPASEGRVEGAAGAIAAGPAWRISMATISEDAPFSVFPGLIRTLGVVQGAGIELTVDGQARLMRVGERSEEFAGDAPASARPADGPALDLNLMVDPSRASGIMRAIAAGDHELVGGTAYFVVALIDGLTVEIDGGRQLGSSVIVDSSVSVEGRVSLVLAQLDTVSITLPGVIRARVSIRGAGAETSDPLAFLLTISDGAN